MMEDSLNSISKSQSDSPENPESSGDCGFYIDKCRLRTIMAQYNDNRETLANYLNISLSTLSYKMNERQNRTFTLEEIRKIITRYHMSSEQIIDVFFKC